MPKNGGEEVLINVTLTSNRLEITGHAPRADNEPPGQNIVCAAVSALTLTLIEGLKAIAGMEIQISEQPGDVRISWDEANDIGRALIDTWYIGITRIRDSYDNTILII